LQGFFRGIEQVLRKANAKPADVDGFLVHATTVVTNALIERRGANTAMIFTQGFADTLRIRDERRYDMYDPQIEFPRPLVDPDSTFAIAERTLFDGTVEKIPDEAEITRLAEKIAGQNIRSVGICFLHSYKNASNEK